MVKQPMYGWEFDLLTAFHEKAGRSQVDSLLFWSSLT